MIPVTPPRGDSSRHGDTSEQLPPSAPTNDKGNITTDKPASTVSDETPRAKSIHKDKSVESIPMFLGRTSHHTDGGRPFASAGSLNASNRSPRSRIGKLYHRSPSGRIIVRRSERHQSKKEGLNATPSETKPAAEEDVTWNMVFRSCCCHSSIEWFRIFVFVFLLLMVLYLFLVGLDLLSTGFKVAQ